MECVQSGVVLLGGNRNLRPHRRFEERFGPQTVCIFAASATRLFGERVSSHEVPRQIATCCDIECAAGGRFQMKDFVFKLLRSHLAAASLWFPAVK